MNIIPSFVVAIKRKFAPWISKQTKQKDNENFNLTCKVRKGPFIEPQHLQVLLLNITQQPLFVTKEVKKKNVFRFVASVPEREID